MIGYSYDISSCVLKSLKVLEIEVPHIEEISSLPKIERNIKIGLFWKHHPELHRIYRQFVNDVIDEYIMQIGPSNVILKQFDGFVSTVPLKSCTCSILPIDFRHCLDPILPIEGNSYIGYDLLSSNIVSKGLRFETLGLNGLLRRLLSIESMTQLKKLFVSVMNGSYDLSLYCIRERSGYFIHLNGGNKVEVNPDKLRLIKLSNINTSFYYNLLRPILRAKIQSLL